jgi:hypothetical protein
MTPDTRLVPRPAELRLLVHGFRALQRRMAVRLATQPLTRKG